MPRNKSLPLSPVSQEEEGELGWQATGQRLDPSLTQSLQLQLHKSVTKAMSAAIGPMTAAISQSMSQAFQQAQTSTPPAPRGKGSSATPALAKALMTDGVTIPSGVSKARKRACPCQAEVLEMRQSASFV